MSHQQIHNSIGSVTQIFHKIGLNGRPAGADPDATYFRPLRNPTGINDFKRTGTKSMSTKHPEPVGSTKDWKRSDSKRVK